MIKLQDNEKVAFAGLLHDVGKLLNRSDEYRKNCTLGTQHPHLSSWFIDYLFENNILEKDNELKELVQKHHEGPYYDKSINFNSIEETREKNGLKKLGLIVARSDNYSSAERIEEESNFGKNNFKTRPLDSIFSRINLRKENEKDKISRYKISMLSEDNIFPDTRDENPQTALNFVIAEFLKEVKSIKVQDAKSLFINLFDLLKKYTWSIPSDTQRKVCDISLFDHLKTTSAIALASYNYHIEEGNLEKIDEKNIIKDKKENHFLLIGGDVSGIQKYIYGLENTKNTAKRLRARSFFIKLLSDVGAYKIIDSLDLTIANIIISSGGKFYILAQNTENTREELLKIKKEINDTLYKEYQADLFLNLEWLEVSGRDLGEKFSERYDELNDKLDVGKGKKFIDNILHEPILENKGYGNGKKVKLCPICNKFLVGENEESCSHCLKDLEFGSLLPKMKKLAFYTKNIDDIKQKEGSINLFGILCKIIKDEEIEGEPYLVNYYSDEIQRNMGYVRDVYGGYVPLNDNGTIKEFEEIAKESSSKNLGIIKGDVDNLGLIFSVGMSGLEEEIEDEETGKKETRKGVISISRIATLSRMLDNFFSYWLPKTLEKNKKELGSNYVVYSGGDDFMIVSSWDKAVEVSKYINKEFNKYVANNDDITITIGVSITKPSDPIYFSSKWATEAEEKGKSSGRNGFVLFDTYIPWEHLEKVFGLIDFFDKNYKKEKTKDEKEKEKELKEKENNGIFNQGFIYRLLHYTDMAESYETTKNPKYLKFISDFTYDLSRNIIPKLKEEYKNKGITDDKLINEKIKKDERITKLNKYFGIEVIENQEDMKFLKTYMRVVINYIVRKNRENREEN